MSTTSTTISFSSIDYKGNNSLSSYAIPLTPILFIPNSDELSLSVSNSHKVVWDFGDGTLSKSFSATKNYNFPGVYTVNMIVYDCNNNAQISTESKQIYIYDYIPFTFNINNSNSGYLIDEMGSYTVSPNGDKIYINDPILELKCGQITGPFLFNCTYPSYQPTSNIFYSVSGSNCENYWDINHNKFSHLDTYQAIYDRTYNHHLSSFQYVEIDKIEIDSYDVYARLVDNKINICHEGDLGAVLIGRKGSKNIYLKSDKISNNVFWKFSFDKTNNVLPIYRLNTNHLNNLGVTMKLDVVDNPPTKLSITSNGLDGEGYEIESFHVNPIKYYNTKIPFVVKLKNINNFSIKNFDKVQLSSLNINLTSKILNSFELLYDNILLSYNGNGILYSSDETLLSSSDYDIFSLNHTLSAQDSGGSFRGYITFPSISSNKILKDIIIQISGNFISSQLSSYTLTGESNKFSVYPDNYFDVYKKNENFNAEQTLMDLRFQETMFEKDVLFKNFLGGVLGNENSDHNGLGLKIYEKISNFVSNTQDIDNCEVDNINSLGTMMSYNDINEENYQYPENIKRLLNLTSISKNNLIGTSNKFNQNLDIRGRTSKNEYGINIGDIIDTLTYRVSAGTPIVALEKFSNTYNLLNTYQPISAVGSTVYSLSSYNSNFGWPMVLPLDFTFKDFDKYYLFFEYIEKIDGSFVGGLVDFGNEKTTIDSNISQKDLFIDNGIVDGLFSESLYKSLDLINQ